MLKTNNKCYWKSFNAVCKNNFNCTNVVEGIECSSNITNLFRTVSEHIEH